MWKLGLGPVLGMLLLAPLAGGAEPGSASQWLERLGPALEKTNYRGMFVYSRGEDVHVMRIAHRYQDGQVFQRLVQQDGAGGEIIRKGDTLICLLPNQPPTQVDVLIPSGPFSRAFRDKLEPLAQWYRPRLVGEDRVAGHEAVVLALGAQDGLRYSHRLWMEKNTGLLVKSQVRGLDGEVLEHFQFTQLEITDEISFEELSSPYPDHVKFSRQVHGLVHAASPTRLPWYLGWTPDGFQPAINEAIKRTGAAVYSDGLVSFSVFVEEETSLDMPEGASQVGATTAYMHELQHAGSVYRITVVGEVPPMTAMRVAQGVRMRDEDKPAGLRSWSAGHD